MNLNTEVSEDQNSEQDKVSDDAESVVNLEAVLTIQNVANLCEKLKKSYSAHEVVEINASQVASIDTATLQLFVALKKEAVKQQKTIVLKEPSQRFVESARLLGLLEVLEIEAFV